MSPQTSDLLGACCTISIHASVQTPSHNIVVGVCQAKYVCTKSKTLSTHPCSPTGCNAAEDLAVERAQIFQSCIHNYCRLFSIVRVTCRQCASELLKSFFVRT